MSVFLCLKKKKVDCSFRCFAFTERLGLIPLQYSVLHFFLYGSGLFYPTDFWVYRTPHGKIRLVAVWCCSGTLLRCGARASQGFSCITFFVSCLFYNTTSGWRFGSSSPRFLEIYQRCIYFLSFLTKFSSMPGAVEKS